MSRPIFEDFVHRRASIAVIGLGYVGLPLAHALARHFAVIGFDINVRRVDELRTGMDRTRELTSDQLQGSSLVYSHDPAVLADARLIIVTVPTPIDEHKRPDLTPLVRASTLLGQHIRPDTTIVFESTVYPGCTEDDCMPVIAAKSGLRAGKDFFVGYSPERINPGDKEHTVEKIRKVVAGDCQETARLLEQIYGTVIVAGIHVAPDIKTAEAAKVIENTQRDLNIALMNELAVIFHRLEINTLDVLTAAGTKWNFLPFRPGLVGGHCIGVDPYYLTFKAEAMGYHPEVILAGRRINDGMGQYVANQTIKKLIAANRLVKGARVLILGWTFKENVPDIRNSRVIDILRELREFAVAVEAFDPLADPEEVRHEYGVDLLQEVPSAGGYAAIILAVRHQAILAEFPLERLRALGDATPPVLIDVKGFFSPEALKASGCDWWQL